MATSRAAYRRRTTVPLTPTRKLSPTHDDGDLVTYRDHAEWAFGVHTSPREKSVLVALANRPGAESEHIARRTSMNPGAVNEALVVLQEEGWVYALAGGGYAIDPVTVEIDAPDSALAAEVMA